MLVRRRPLAGDASFVVQYGQIAVATDSQFLVLQRTPDSTLNQLQHAFGLALGGSSLSRFDFDQATTKQ